MHRADAPPIRPRERDRGPYGAGKYVVMVKGESRFPARCILTNEPVPEPSVSVWISGVGSGGAPFADLPGILGGFGVMLMLMTGSTSPLLVGLNEEEQSRRDTNRWRAILLFAVAALLLALGIGGLVYLGSGAGKGVREVVFVLLFGATMAGAFLGLISLLWLYFGNRPLLRPFMTHGNLVWLEGAGAPFIASLPQYKAPTAR